MLEKDRNESKFGKLRSKIHESGLQNKKGLKETDRLTEEKTVREKGRDNDSKQKSVKRSKMEMNWKKYNGTKNREKQHSVVKKNRT